jgi:hypothetical protein
MAALLSLAARAGPPDGVTHREDEHWDEDKEKFEAARTAVGADVKNELDEIHGGLLSAR